MTRIVTEAITIADALRRSGWRVSQMRFDEATRCIGFAVQTSSGVGLYVKCADIGVTVTHKNLHLMSGGSVDPTSTGPRWSGPCCPCSESDRESLYTELARFLNTLNCLPGRGYLKIVVNKMQVTGYRLPFATQSIPLAIRRDLLLAMICGGGCEIRLRIPGSSASLLTAVCLHSGTWCRCPPQDVITELRTGPREIAVRFPSPDSVEVFAR